MSAAGARAGRPEMWHGVTTSLLHHYMLLLLVFSGVGPIDDEPRGARAP